MVGKIRSECNKKERLQHGYNYNVYFKDENFVMPSCLSLECYGYDEEWVILKEVKNNTDDNDMDITTD